MNGYTMPLTCPHCAGLLEPVCQSKPVAFTEAQAIARCPECHWSWQVTVHVRRVVWGRSEAQHRHEERKRVSA